VIDDKSSSFMEPKRSDSNTREDLIRQWFDELVIEVIVLPYSVTSQCCSWMIAINLEGWVFD
jgi:hypothetical protein